MPPFELFPRDQIIGVFRGFTEGGLEFHADLVLPYRNEFQNVPMHGQFLLVQLETPNEAVLGRIASFSSDGRLASGQGEEFNIRAVRENRPVPEDLREHYLKYRVNIRVLGVVRCKGAVMTFVASHRRLPHVGSPVAFLSGPILREIAGHNAPGATIGHLALGEYIYASGDRTVELQDWMQVKEPHVAIKFPVQSLVARRSFIFARAGFGKSNLNKLLFSKLYSETPMVTKRGGRQVPVGTIIFDPDGEYFWPDDKGRPGLCDVPALRDKLIVFTPRRGPSPFYQSFVAGGVKLDIRRMRPADVIAIALDPERQDQQNVAKLRSLNQQRWQELVDLIDDQRNQAPADAIAKLLQLDAKQEIEAFAARSNMTRIVTMLHDKSSQLIDLLMLALSKGKLCVVDISQMRGSQSLILSGLILRRIFDRNQEEFTAAEPRTIPTIAVIEEAQSVLSVATTSTEPYITWVKEGRKYDLGAVLVTQQPGSIPTEILSQGDNWFIFHLLSSADLTTLKKANAHFSDDLLSALLNEPIPGQGVFWSSVGEKPYPLPVRVSLFEQMYKVADPHYDQAQVETYVQELYKELGDLQPEDSASGFSGNGQQPETVTVNSPSPVDPLERYQQRAIDALSRDALLEKVKTTEGAAYGALKAFFLAQLPSNLDGVDDMAYNLVAKALDKLIGPQNQAWYSYKHPSRNTRYAKVGSKPN